MAHNSNQMRRFYAMELQPILKQLEIRRIETRNQVVLNTGVVGAIATIIALLFSRWFGLFGLIFLGFLAVAGCSAMNSGPIHRYRTHFKKQVMQRLVAVYNPTLSYSPDQGIRQEEFVRSSLYRHRIDRYRSEDLLTGTIGATSFHFSEVHAEYKTQSQSGKNRKTQWHTLFKGIFFVADFNKNFHGMTLVIPDQAERTLGNMGQLFQEWGAKLGLQPGELVKLEDPEFERLFAVYSTDQVEARYILSTSLMERLVSFRQRVQQDIAISFVNTQVYIALSSSRNRFEPPSLLKKSAPLSLEQIQAHFDDIRFAGDIVQDLNLNTRIWGK